MDQTAAKVAGFTQSDYLDQSEKLVRKLRTFSTPQLMEFMEISKALATLNRQCFRVWGRPFSPDNAKPALCAFTGDVYDGLEANTLNKTQIRFAQKHVRMLSGL